MDWQGVAVVLQKAAKDYETFRDAAIAAEKIVGLERAEQTLQTSIVDVTARRDAIVKEANGRAEAWNLRERDLSMSHESRKTKLAAELLDAQAGVKVALAELGSARSQLADFLSESDKRRSARAKEIEQEEKEYTSRIAKVKKQLEDAKAAVAKA